MTVGILYTSSNIPRWVEKIEESLKNQLDIEQVQYIISENDILFRIPGFSLYHLIDNRFLSFQNSPFDFVKTVDSTNRKDFDLLINLSFDQPENQIKFKRQIQLVIGQDNQAVKNLTNSFINGYEVIECSLRDSTGFEYKFVEGVDGVSWTRTLHNLFHRIHADLELQLNNQRCVFIDEMNKTSEKKTQFSLLYRILIGFFDRKFKAKRWEVILQKKDETEPPKKILSTNQYFYADPFLVEKGKDIYLFLEKKIYKNNKAHLVLKSSIDNFKSEQDILNTEYHLSYPQVLFDKGEYYLLPESSENHSLELYRADQFPKQWHKIRTIFDDEKIVDATLLKYNGLYYLFFNTQVDSDMSVFSVLKIYYTNDLVSGQWHEHPYKHFIDVRYARQGGSFIYEQGNLYRVSQDNSKSYGRKITIFKVDELTENKYSEKIDRVIKPEDLNKRYTGVHTYNESDNYVVIDAFLI